ncbi:hypothetical protein SAMN02799631_03241 [Methylobacterium sp. 174MFSha1.1]|uniref:hypothetical protein n=1 Tax=Methylobacterium sp. 174MFSha1.1 TaxID=1502749 RepID=UPI0008DFAE40|nr:hypothetical protein [Methylobacterium sp. 174MFSha1.1]SFU93421.1 hypothetical protein SAMN02799631_03241 [Methylobacterium sp. 174MFSha1.1]
MPEAIPTSTMDALLARPLDLAGLTSPAQLQAIAAHAAELVDEARWLEGCALVAELSPDETHAALRARPAKYLHELHSVVMERAYAAMPVVDVHVFDLVRPVAPAPVVTAGVMMAQVEAFRANPGAYLPGALPSAGVAVFHASHAVDGWITLDGEDLPWSYGSVGVSRLLVSELAEYVRAAPDVRRGLVVGTHVQADVDLPPELTFVSLANLPTATGPEAA